MVKPAQVQFLHIPVLSRASVLGCSQLNRQKLRVGSCTEEVRKWFNCPMQGTISNAKLASRRYRIDLHHRFARACRGQSDSGESCIVLIASCLSCCCSTWTSGEEHGNGAMDKFVRTFDAQCRGTQSAPEQLQLLAQQTYLPNLPWWTVTWRTLKNHKTVKIGGWALARVWSLVRDNTVVT